MLSAFANSRAPLSGVAAKGKRGELSNRTDAVLRCSASSPTGSVMSDETEQTNETVQADVSADTPPDHLAIDPRSPHFDQEVLQRGVAIRFKERQRTDIEEYCISEGWIRVQAGKTLDRKGRPLTLKLSGPVEAWFEDLGDSPPVAKK